MEDDLRPAAVPVPAQVAADAGRDGGVAAGQSLDLLGLVVEVLDGLQGVGVQPLLRGQLRNVHGRRQLGEQGAAALAQAFETFRGQCPGPGQEEMQLGQAVGGGIGPELDLGPTGAEDNRLGQGGVVKDVLQVMVRGDGRDHVFSMNLFLS